MYRIKKKLIEEIFSGLVSVKIEVDDINNAYREEYKLGGVLISYDNMTQVAEIVCNKNILEQYSGVILETKGVDLSKLTKKHKIRLVLNYLKSQGYLRDLFKFHRILRHYESGRLLILRFPFKSSVGVEYDGTNFYLVVWPKYELVEEDTIAEMLMKGKISVEELIENLLEGNWKIQTARRDIDSPSTYEVEEIIRKDEDPEKYSRELLRINEYFTKKTDLGPIDDSAFLDKYNIIFKVKGSSYSYHSARTKLVRPIDKEIYKEIHKPNNIIGALNLAKELVGTVIDLDSRYSGRVVVEGYNIPNNEIDYKIKVLTRDRRIVEEYVKPYYKIKSKFEWLFNEKDFNEIECLILPLRIPTFLKGKKLEST